MYVVIAMRLDDCASPLIVFVLQDPVNGLDWDEYKSLAFGGRAISIWRTAYSSICQVISTALPHYYYCYYC
jgi:hypothetical protein